ncbi:molybdopterin molybdotransferase [Nonomuraea thailandensis]|uniref:Molybdopterin molybdenumtransferase n=1 Tax=Nonomuraea thailandensis TaxID=1188745 RepID=A0A9X2GEL0_9ACTN|nr:molybdopterin-binding protein [Nonomuraea thailandensis]MCP2355999.1 molybdopterin molybdotransferase [Nonomuraea thailandensis]
MVTTADQDTRRDVAWATARRFAHAAAEPAPAVRVALGQAAGLTLAEDLVVATPLPAFDTSAMDGYAVAGAGPWSITGSARPGRPWTGERLTAGNAVEISTGAVVPPGTWAVLPVESATVCDGRVTCPDGPGGTRDGRNGCRDESGGARDGRNGCRDESGGARDGQVGRRDESAAVSDGRVAVPGLARGKHIRYTGEDAPAGTRLAPAGTAVGPALLGLAATCGYDELLVHPTPVVRAIVTGDELARHGLPGPGRVRDALGPLLPSLIAELGGRLDGLVHVPDQPVAALAEAVEAAAGADVVVVTGSTSVGVTDGLRRLLAERDVRWIVDSVACRPGHPALLARLPGGPYVIGLPGNPFAALAAAHTLLGPLLAGLSGRALGDLPQAPLTSQVPVPAGRTRIVPVVWDGPGVRALGGDRPAFLNGAALADALAAVPYGHEPGRPVPLLLLRG